MEDAKIKTIDELKDIVAQARKEGKKTVFTNGCFDILHLGHIRCLREARAQGDLLIVALNSDESVKKIKKDTRPIIGQNERAEILAALLAVDYITIFNDETPCALIKQLKPDIHIKGGDYKPEELPEAEAVKSYGGSIVIIPQIHGKGTTNIIQNILDRYGEQNK